jgi:serine/threonine protein kinase
LEEVIGKGTFGTVYRAVHRSTGENVAIKKVLQDKRYKNRELQILKLLHHPNVLEIINHYFTVDEVASWINSGPGIFKCGDGVLRRNTLLTQQEVPEELQ